MVECIVWIILAGVVFADDRVDRKIQKQSAVFSDDLFQDLFQVIFRHDFSQDQIGPCPKAAAAVYLTGLLFRQFDLREKLQEVHVREHPPGIVWIQLSDRCALRHTVLVFRIIFSAVCVVDICRSLDTFCRDPGYILRDLYGFFQVHGTLLFREIIASLLLYHVCRKKASSDRRFRLNFNDSLVHHLHVIALRVNF